MPYQDGPLSMPVERTLAYRYGCSLLWRANRRVLHATVLYFGVRQLQRFEAVLAQLPGRERLVLNIDLVEATLAASAANTVRNSLLTCAVLAMPAAPEA